MTHHHIPGKAQDSSSINVSFNSRDTVWRLIGCTYVMAEYTGYYCESEGKSEKLHLICLDGEMVGSKWSFDFGDENGDADSKSSGDSGVYEHLCAVEVGIESGVVSCEVTRNSGISRLLEYEILDPRVRHSSHVLFRDFSRLR